MTSGFLEDEADAAREALPRGFLLSKTLLTGLRQSIEARAPIVLGRAPVSGDPALFLEPLQRRIERTLLHLQDLVRELSNPLRDRPAMQRFERDRLEDEKVDGALDQVGWLPHDYLQESVWRFL